MIEESGAEPNNPGPDTVSSGDGSSGDGSAGTSPRATGFDDLYRRRADDAFRYAAAIVGPDEARDACQDAWLKVWRAWGSADPDRVDAWAFRIIRNSCIDRQRARRASEPLDERELPSVLATEDVVVPQLEASAAMPLLRSLGKPLREVLWLREVVGMSYAEIAEVQEIPIGTVMSRLHAARRKAAAILRKEGW